MEEEYFERARVNENIDELEKQKKNKKNCKKNTKELEESLNEG